MRPATVGATLRRNDSPIVRRMLRSERVEAAAHNLINMLHGSSLGDRPEVAALIEAMTE